MVLGAGANLGPYEILAPLGAGGMGEVYRARDSRLGRQVAIKVSRERFTERFENEVRTLAALNHPNICTIHDVGPNYLVMELLEGETLADRIKRGSLEVEEALTISRQMADGLAAAQARGIVHRDLKPGNIMLTQVGVKILDFGLTKTLAAAAAEETVTSLTEDGIILGTPHYMAPEQVEGRTIDFRTDVFAFGIVLY